MNAIQHIANATIDARTLRSTRVLRTGPTCPPGCEACAETGHTNNGPVPALDAEIGELEPGSRVMFSGYNAAELERLPDWVKQAKSAGAKQVIVQTDGRSLAYDGLVRVLMDAGTDLFAIPLHGPVAPLHDWVSQTKGSFMQSVRGIQNVRKAGGTVILNTVIVRSNFRHLAKLVSVGDKFGVRLIRLLWPYEAGMSTGSLLSVTPVPDVVRPYVADAEEQATRTGLRLHVELPPTGEKTVLDQFPESA